MSAIAFQHFTIAYMPTINEHPFCILPDTAQEVTATAVGD